MHIPKEKRRKLNHKVGKCIFIRYKDGLNVYKMWNPITRKENYIRDAIFREVKDTSVDEEIKRENLLENKEFQMNEKSMDIG